MVDTECANAMNIENGCKTHAKRLNFNIILHHEYGYSFIASSILTFWTANFVKYYGESCNSYGMYECIRWL